MLDKDLAGLYDVQTGRLNEQVRRNIKRFPADCVPRTYCQKYGAVQEMRADLSQSAGKSGLQTTSSCFD